MMSVHSSPEPEVRRSSRQRILTSPAKDEFQSRVSKYASQLREVKNDLDAGISHIDEVKTDSDALLSVHKMIDSCYRAYCELSTNFVDYLRTVRTTESDGEEAAHKLIKGTVDCKVDLAFKRLNLLLNPPPKSKDGRSTKSSSSRSKLSSAAERKQAELDAIVIRKKFLNAEADILRQKMDLETKLKALKIEQDIEIKQAEIDAIQNTSVKLELGSVTSSKRHARTQEYVNSLPDAISHLRDPELELTNSMEDCIPDPVVTTQLKTADVNITTQQHPAIAQPLPVQTPSQPVITCTYVSEQHEFPRQHCPTQTTTARSTFKPHFTSSQLQLPKPHFQPDSTPQGHTEVQSQFNPYASPFLFEKPALRSNAARSSHLDNNPYCSHSHYDNRQSSDDRKCDPIADITKFLLKKDLILSRITKYDDNPTFYLAWKLTFQSVMSELDATPSEELDLLIRWLGTDSSRQAATIRKCNAADPVTALKLVWERLEERFGSPELIESSLKRNIATFPRITNQDYKRLYNLADLAAEIDSVKRQPQYAVIFGYFDSPTGINSLVAKLPPNLQEKWTVEATKYKKRETAVYPPFTFFVKFIKDLAKMKNDPSFNYDTERVQQPRTYRNVSSTIPVVSKKTETQPTGESDPARCPFHHTRHLLNECNGFRQKSMQDRKKFIMANGICIRCCGPKKHRARNCKATIRCSVCKASSHPTALHDSTRVHEGEMPTKKTSLSSHPNTPTALNDIVQLHEGETATKEISSTCTQVCGSTTGTSKSCAKIVPARVYPEGLQQQSRIVYAMIDDQSNHCLASSSFFDAFNQNGPSYAYTLASCSGKVVTSGRRAPGFVIESIDRNCVFKLPTLIECAELPNNRDEIPSPHIAGQYTHLHDIVDAIPELINDAGIEILIGRDLIAAHVVQDQRYCSGGVPYAQKLPLGWVIIGSVCLDELHVPEHISVNKTCLLGNGRPSLFEPCDSKLIVKDNIFVKTELDEKTAISIDDQRFLDVMDSGFKKDPDGRWTAPLPFRSNRPPLPNNIQQAVNRAESLDRSLRHNPVKKEHASQFMTKIFERGHAEIAPSIPESSERWYLPMFGVYHRKKKDSIRMVFDSSACFKGVSLNEVLLKGPDVYNNLQGILLRFRREQVALTADIEQIFHNFSVHAEHRDYLCLLWHPENDLSRPLVEYQMTVPVSGNRPYLAIAYLKVWNNEMSSDTSVLFGKAKVALSHGHTIVLLMLCSAVMAVETAEFITDSLD